MCFLHQETLSTMDSFVQLIFEKPWLSLRASYSNLAQPMSWGGDHPALCHQIYTPTQDRPMRTVLSPGLEMGGNSSWNNSGSLGNSNSNSC